MQLYKANFRVRKEANEYDRTKYVVAKDLPKAQKMIEKCCEDKGYEYLYGKTFELIADEGPDFTCKLIFKGGDDADPA